jgi:hypothetical protein
VNHRGRCGVQEMQADEIEAWLIGDDAAFVHRLAVSVIYGLRKRAPCCVSPRSSAEP